ncbi:hypothetical protein U9M48_016959 [Paspalum notatum var. saurae]|uniref:Uncharacterized protein n=1 Tax=Paspalum notatum var. saurae TaxID=547442 RepID=A0AAQ3WN40_PASNO
MRMYPEANVHVFQLSVRDGACRYNLGRALAPLRLRDDGACSSSGPGRERHATHSLRPFAPTSHASRRRGGPPSSTPGSGSPSSPGGTTTWSATGRRCTRGQTTCIVPTARRALGAAGDACKAELIHRSRSNATLSYAPYRFTNQN